MRNLKIIQLTLLAVLFSVGTLFAQDDYTWDAHGVGFSVPSDFIVQSNADNEFSASSGDVYLSIASWEDESVDKEGLEDAAVDAALELNLDELTDADELEIDVFVGYYVEGAKNGLNAFIATLLDTESDTNIVVIIVYKDGHEDEATNIILSLYGYE